MFNKSICTQLELWTLLWLLLVILSMVAVNETITTCKDHVVNTWHHQADECDTKGAILLSRAFTTLGWARGFAVGYSLLSIILVIWAPNRNRASHINVCIKTPLCVALLIFSAAFDVNMFHTTAHGILITLGSILGTVFTFPGVQAKGVCNICYREDRELKVCGYKWFTLKETWWFLWIFMVVNFVLFMGFWGSSCVNDNVPNGRCPVLRSNWYWTEYLFFWTMYLLVGYAVIAEELVEVDDKEEASTKLLDKSIQHKRFDGLNYF